MQVCLPTRQFLKLEEVNKSHRNMLRTCAYGVIWERNEMEVLGGRGGRLVSGAGASSR